ncbi:MAG: DNA mismatch repair protein MutS [Spirochaetes bacterium]|nr:DNA mismatch repair protein MutS [Spirochaetota bacterium]
MSDLDVNDDLFDTPMMKQFKAIKEKHPDAFLFFRCGDFYEMFGSDAVQASKILDITLTKRQAIPMCGVPYHAVDSYIAKMIKAGKKIAICEQMEDPKTVKGIVKRDVTQIITPGTLVEEKMLSNKNNNYLVAINIKGLFIELSCLDLSTGDFELNEIELQADLSLLKGELMRTQTKEIIIPESIWLNQEDIRSLLLEYENILINRYPDWYFTADKSQQIVFEHFNVNNWSELKIQEQSTDLTTPGVILQYVKENAKTLINHIKRIIKVDLSQTMLLDEATIRNLELIRNLQDGSVKNSLLDIIDDTSTSMGGRLLKKWLIEPLINVKQIKQRLQYVDFFYKNQVILEKVDASLKEIMDLERLIARVVMSKATPKDLVSIKNSLSACQEVKNLLLEFPVMKILLSGFIDLNHLIEEIDTAIKDEPATFIHEGNIVKPGYSEKLDELKKISTDSKELIANLESSVKEQYQTPSLRIRYNKILGYFYEVSKIQSKNLDEQVFFIRQSLVNTIRYSNKQLSELESKIMTAKEQINAIEGDVFSQIKEKIFQSFKEIQNNAYIISQLDVFLSFAKIALVNHYCKPVIEENFELVIKEGRHPVIEKKLDLDEFIPNDLFMNNHFLHIITGPNMAGKSTFLRQNALIVLLAQIGSFVPAAQASIGIVDRIFTRIGASDNLTRGQSTFLVEMNETANILQHATERSLIIMDEIGRGTSTYDGLAIAWAILEFIANKNQLGAKTLFATHYHELTVLEQKEGIKNYSVLVSEDDHHFVFLHKLIDKPAEKSYGIQVARLANLPREVIQYAEIILHKLEEKKDNQNAVKENIDSLFNMTELENNHSQFQQNKKKDELIQQLQYLDINKITPLQALNILADLQKKIDQLNK